MTGIKKQIPPKAAETKPSPATVQPRQCVQRRMARDDYRRGRMRQPPAPVRWLFKI